MPRLSIREELQQMADAFERSAAGLLTVTSSEYMTFEKGTYKVLLAKPSKRLAASLTIDREIAVLITSFTDLQARTTRALRKVMDRYAGRLESTVGVIIHKDQKGHTRLKNWGRESGVSVLPIYYRTDLPVGEEFERLLCHEMYSHDSFDITGPVSGDAHFFGRRSEAQDLSRALQRAQIRSALGIRKIGKTSIINRVVAGIRDNFDSLCVMVDCSQDRIWGMTASELMSALDHTIQTAVTSKSDYLALEPAARAASIADGTKQLVEAVSAAERPVILLFDEVDYITPGSPTASHWRSDFNVFWRNFRSVYQETCRQDSILSVLICGVSSKWFAVESIDGVENAALSLIPEEYLSPLPRGATVAMIRKIGRIAGLQFDEHAGSLIAQACADMPFWVRKAGSYIHRNIDVNERPVQVLSDRVAALLDTFLKTDGATLAHVALRHLFRVYPELKETVEQAMKKQTDLSTARVRVLQRYGILDLSSPPTLAGDMVQLGCELYFAEKGSDAEEATDDSSVFASPLDEWAEELAVIGRRRNMLEKRMRSMVVNFIRVDFLQSSAKGTVSERILAVVPSKRRAALSKLPAEEAVEKLLWRELVEIVAAKEWGLFINLFGDKAKFRNNCEIVNDRPDAHAKSVDAADLALYRRCLGELEQALGKVL